jgi:hypothetical protein
MYISLATSRTTGFRKWADIHQPTGDQPARTPQGSLPPPVFDHSVTPLPARPYRPWAIPGVGSAF